MQTVKSLLLVLVSFFASFFHQPSQTITRLQENINPAPTKILDNGLPNKHLIKTAFVAQAPEKQWDQPWQDACEEAALITVDYYYRQISPSIVDQKNAILSMITFEDQQGWTHDVNLNQMAIIGSQYLSYQTKIITNPSIKDIKTYLAQDIPVIIPANGKTLYRENRHFKNGGPWYHNLVILGYNDELNQFTVHDVGTQFGPYFHYTYNTILDSIHDFPSTGHKEDINSGPKKILLLLK